MGNKYKNVRTNGYASRKEANHAANLHALAKSGQIFDLEEQVSFELLPKMPPDYPRALKYVCDFRYRDALGVHIVDAKGYLTQEYKLKKRLMKQLLGIEIEEV